MLMAMFYHRFKILKLSGFDVSVDASWIFIAFLLVWSLAGFFFPSQYPNLETSTYIWLAIIAAFGFFASIVIHEYCHALVAQRYGMPMKGITLWLLGGVAEMSDEPPSAKAEFLMAGAGPLASIAIAASCFGLARLGEMQGWSVLAVGVLSYLWRINLILTLFNLIPAFPLDGGRLLRALLWGWTGKMRWSTSVASSIGVGFGIFLMLLGIFALFSGNPVVGLWYFLIGLFIRFSAQSSYMQLLIKDNLKDVTLGRFIKSTPVFVPQNESVASLVENYFYEYPLRLFPVVDASGKLRGCVRSEAIRQIPPQDWRAKKVQDIMEPCSEVNTIDVSANASEALQKMSDKHSKRLIVMDQDRILGVVTLGDILRFVSIRLELNPPLEDNDKPDIRRRHLPLTHRSEAT